jgi:hypothetical protein
MPDNQTSVTFAVWNRPAYLRRVLEAWSKVRGIEDAVLEFHCDPGCQEAVAICENVSFAERRVSANANRLGATFNVKKALDTAFENAGYAVLATDDFVPSTDALELHAWHRDNYRDDNSVLALVCGRGAAAPGGLAAVWRSQVMGWLPGFHREKWKLLSPQFGESENRPGGWYHWIDQEFCFSRGYDILLPAMSRAQDIGEEGSFPLPMPFEQIQSPSFIADCPPQRYHEVTGKRERGFDQRIEEV